MSDNVMSIDVDMDADIVGDTRDWMLGLAHEEYIRLANRAKDLSSNARRIKQAYLALRLEHQELIRKNRDLQFQFECTSSDLARALSRVEDLQGDCKSLRETRDNLERDLWEVKGNLRLVLDEREKLVGELESMRNGSEDSNHPGQAPE